MNNEKGYSDYVNDEEFLDSYNAYQDNYREDPRKSDISLIKIIRENFQHQENEKPIRIMDIGCSTGNLLRMLKKEFPNADMTGADLAKSSIEACRSDLALTGITFEELDMVNLPDGPLFDLIIANAVTFYFEDFEYDQAIHSVARRLKKGGLYIAFEWLHPFNQEIRITEKSITHPKGLILHQRSYNRTSKVLQEAGFQKISFFPFNIDIDLPIPNYEGNVTTYTRKLMSGERLCFRGTMFQPWCYLVARK